MYQDTKVLLNNRPEGDFLGAVFNPELLDKIRDQVSAHQSGSLKPSSVRVYCPSKVFLIGEYAVLWGQPALVLGLEPSFSLDLSVQARAGFSAWGQAFSSVRCPAGVLMRVLQTRLDGCPLYFRFRDPIEGKGGLGASTAQFLLVIHAAYQFAQMSPPPILWIWELYRDLAAVASESSLQPSGADLVAQALGRGVLFRPQNGSLATPLEMEGLENRLLVFLATTKATRKVATHEHLVELSMNGRQRIFSDRWLQTASRWIRLAVEALENGDWKDLGLAMTGYGQFLCESELESKAATEDRLFFQEMKGVLGVKGAGALLSDVLCVLLEPGKSTSEEQQVREVVLFEARKRGLTLVGSDNGFLKLASPRGSLEGGYE